MQKWPRLNIFIWRCLNSAVIIKVCFSIAIDNLVTGYRRQSVLVHVITVCKLPCYSPLTWIRSSKLFKLAVASSHYQSPAIQSRERVLLSYTSTTRCVWTREGARVPVAREQQQPTTQLYTIYWTDIDGFQGIFSLWQLEGKGSRDVDIDKPAGSMVM